MGRQTANDVDIKKRSARQIRYRRYSRLRVNLLGLTIAVCGIWPLGHDEGRASEYHALNPASADTQSDSAVLSARDSILRALLWMRTSGEYEALCRQAFNTALGHVRKETQKLRSQTSARPPAVIMDLDQTVLDNTAYDVYLLRNGLAHSQQRWHRWNRENMDKITLVPGAKGFIKQVEQEGVRVVFISNRSNSIRDITVRILLKFELAKRQDLLDHDKLLLRDRSSSKESRRAAVTERYEVIALIGDNLGDFSDDFRSPAVTTVSERRAKVREHADHWGKTWFVLPNPIYGDWFGFIDWDQPARHFENPNR